MCTCNDLKNGDIIHLNEGGQCVDCGRGVSESYSQKETIEKISEYAKAAFTESEEQEEKPFFNLKSWLFK